MPGVNIQVLDNDAVNVPGLVFPRAAERQARAAAFLEYLIPLVAFFLADIEAVVVFDLRRFVGVRVVLLVEARFKPCARFVAFGYNVGASFFSPSIVGSRSASFCGGASTLLSASRQRRKASPGISSNH